MIQCNMADGIITERGCPQIAQSVFNTYCSDNIDGNYPNPYPMRHLGQGAFISCVGNLAYCFQCQSGLVFVKSGLDDHIGRCDAENVEDRVQGQIGAGVYIDYCPDTFKAMAKSQCTEKADGNYVFPIANNRYPGLYMACVGGIGYCERCINGLVFKVETVEDRIGMCDYPSS